MKNIALFCDGTWQNLSQSNPSNVTRLARSVAPRANRAADGGACEQFIYYDDGVGVGQGVLDGVTRLTGGGLGKGLEVNILHAYEFLCLNYCPGDRIFIFGFSRGAYTARSLAGLLRKCWILGRENASDADLALEICRNHANYAQTDFSGERDDVLLSWPMSPFRPLRQTRREVHSCPGGKRCSQS